MTAPNRPPSPKHPLGRARLQTLLKTALTVGEPRYAQRIALAWLAAFPGDLGVSLGYARALLLDPRPDVRRQALPQIERLCRLDPEFLEAWEIRIGRQTSPADEAVEPTVRCEPPDLASACVFALGGSFARTNRLPAWAMALKKVRQRLAGGDLPAAERLLLPFLPGGDLRQPLDYTTEAAVEPSVTPLVAISQLRLLAAHGRPLSGAHGSTDSPQGGHFPPSILLALRSLAERYHQRWPDCLVLTLYLADTLMETGQDELGVALLHQTAALDVAGQVITRTWGAQHPYRALWPANLEIEASGVMPPQEIPVPAAVAAALGWNLLPQPAPVETDLTRRQPCPEEAGEIGDMHPRFAANRGDARSVPGGGELDPRQPKAHIPEALRSVQAELERIAAHLNRPGLARNDGRFPVYVILTTRQGLCSQYGAENTARMEDEMTRLLTAIRASQGWDTCLLIADDPQRMSALGLKPAPHHDPWQLKLALADLDQVLYRRGEMIGAVLIVGGAEVVPFHHLPNPVDDVDIEVPSDNPYASRDENYFVPEWPVGRLPGGSGSDPGLLFSLLRQATTQHLALAQRRPQAANLEWIRNAWRRWRAWMLALARQVFSPDRPAQCPSQGYTAAVWRRASLAVYRAIGDPHSLLISPPQQADRLPNAIAPRLGYFNLHGVIDAVEWFGQRDPLEPGDGPDYPVALRPQDVVAPTPANGSVKTGIPDNGQYHPPQIIFSEACYGAYLFGKTLEESLALKFLAAGSQAMVGSTVTSYGSLTLPLIAADLLGRAFWHYIKEGFPAGEALRRAKISLAREMHHRQGYLDGEDQKTLISFVLYGEPLAQSLPPARGAKNISRRFAANRPLETECVKTLCDQGMHPGIHSRVCAPTASHQPGPIPVETLAQVKRLAAHYLPGMRDAEVRLVRDDQAESWPPEQLPGQRDIHPGMHPGDMAVPLAQENLVGPADGQRLARRQPARKVVTLSKRVEQHQQIHNQVARLTLDERGRLVKLSVSR